MDQGDEVPTDNQYRGPNDKLEQKHGRRDVANHRSSVYEVVYAKEGSRRYREWQNLVYQATTEVRPIPEDVPDPGPFGR
ncbi:hypothetical protein PI125_g11322 [Phytophthora idaei]|nr:hypothetical protein PI125_g11322 [Phytophthora idaei]